MDVRHLRRLVVAVVVMVDEAIVIADGKFSRHYPIESETLINRLKFNLVVAEEDHAIVNVVVRAAIHARDAVLCPDRDPVQ